MENPNDIWFAASQPLRVGKVDGKHVNLTNTSFRVSSLLKELKPGEEFTHKFEIFTGPKRPPLLAQYGLSELIYYGWPVFAGPALVMSWILHGFYFVVRNYGLAIILLTVLVRGCMFPLSIKQARSQQKMQELQPEIKRLTEKYKTDMQARSKAQQELFRKHNYNPLGGCLVLFIQLPILIGLYKSLMYNVELARRAADLLGRAMVFEFGRARHALQLDLVHAGVRRYHRLGHILPGSIFQSVAGVDADFIYLATKNNDAAGGRRTGRHATESHEIHDDFHGHNVLQSGQRIVHLLYCHDPVGRVRAASFCPRPSLRRQRCHRSKLRKKIKQRSAKGK